VYLRLALALVAQRAQRGAGSLGAAVGIGGQLDLVTRLGQLALEPLDPLGILWRGGPSRLASGLELRLQPRPLLLEGGLATCLLVRKGLFVPRLLVGDGRGYDLHVLAKLEQQGEEQNRDDDQGGKRRDPQGDGWVAHRVSRRG